jgi:hypothetical protein
MLSATRKYYTMALQIFFGDQLIKSSRKQRNQMKGTPVLQPHTKTGKYQRHGATSVA